MKCAGAPTHVSHISAHAKVLLIDGAFVFARENRFLLQEREIMGQQLECALLLHIVDIMTSISTARSPR